MTEHSTDIPLFDGYNLTSARELRFLAVAISEYKDGLGNGMKLRALSDERKATITRVAIQMVGSPSLRAAIDALVAVDFECDNALISAGRMLQVFTYFEVGSPRLQAYLSVAY